jgi:hypothetical protein
VAVTEGLAAAECVPVGVEDPEAPVAADVGDVVVAEAAADAFVAVVDAAEGFDPLPPHAARLTPPMTAAMITAGTRHVLMIKLPDG